MSDSVQTPEQIKQDNETATKAASDALSKQIEALASEIQAGTLRVREAATAPAPVVTPHVAAPMTSAEMNALAEEKGVGPVVEEYTKRVTGPAMFALLAQNAKLQKQMAENDPKTGPLMKRFSKQIEAKAKELGLNDAYFAEKGYAAVARMVAAEDETYFEERITEEAAKRAPAPAPAPTPSPAPAARQEGVYTGPATSAPNAPESREDSIRKIKVDAAEAEVAEKMGISVEDVKVQRYEMEQQAKKYGGEKGLRRIGGMPIVSFKDMGLPE